MITIAIRMTQPQFRPFMKMPSPPPWTLWSVMVGAAIGAPQFGHAGARSETLRPQSGQALSGTGYQ